MVVARRAPGIAGGGSRCGRSGLDFSLTEEQIVLRHSVARFLREHYAFDARRCAVESGDGWRPSIWKSFVEQLGIIGLGVPKPLGGAGGGPVEMMIVMEEMGRALVIEPFIETAIIGAALLIKSDSAASRAALQSMVAGDMLVAFAWSEPGMRYEIADMTLEAHRSEQGWHLTGDKSVVAGAPWATHLIVAARTSGEKGDRQGLSLFLVEREAEGLAFFDYPTIDGRRASDLMFNGVLVTPDMLIGQEDGAFPLIEEAIFRGIAATCAEAVGAMQRMVDDSMAHIRDRHQFGKALSDFQALQHRMVDMFMKLEMARSATLLATLRLDGDTAESALAISSAKVTVAQAARFVGQNAIQLHGGMGMTDDLPLGHYFKRAVMIEGEFGTVDHHLSRHVHLSRLQVA